MRGIIYKWTNKINNKCYIGKTTREEKRKYEHLNSRRSNSCFHKALDKYGTDNFTYDVLFETYSNSTKNLDTILNALEIFYIKKYNSNNKKFGYNMTVGGDGVSGRYGELNPFYGHHHTEKVKREQSKRIKSMVWTKEQILKRNEALKKVVHTEEWNKKVGLANQKPITAYKDGVIVGSWKCYNDCVQALNLTNKKGISKVVCGYRKTYKGYTFA